MSTSEQVQTLERAPDDELEEVLEAVNEEQLNRDARNYLADWRQGVPETLRRPHEQPVERVLRQCWDRLNVRNEHYVMAIVGEEGAGKSYTAAKISDEIDDEFSHEQIIFRAETFLQLLRDDEYREGGMYVVDEAGVSFGSRTWQDRAQVLANQALQLIRSHNVGLIFTLPILDELDSQTQGRLQAFYEITHKERDECVIGKWKWMDPDRSGMTGNIYKHYPRTDDGNRITSVGFTPPRESIVEPYEERKAVFQKEKYDKAIEQLQGDDQDEELTAKEIAEEIRDEGTSKYIKTINNGAKRVFDRNRVEAEFEVGDRRSKQVKSLILPELDDGVI